MNYLVDMISVIISVWNAPKELQKCLRSLEKQTYSDFEVIVVDDGSVVEISNFKFQIPNLDIKFFRIDHGGAPRARNFGFDKSKGEYILFCDADLELRSDCLENMHQVLQNNADASYVYSDFKYGFKKFKFWEFDADKLRQMNYVNTCSMARRSAMEGIRWDESLGKFQDWDLWLQMLNRNRVGIYVSEILFKAHTRRGIYSKWLPSFLYKLPIKLKSKDKYEKWKKIVQDKHGI